MATKVYDYSTAFTQNYQVDDYFNSVNLMEKILVGGLSTEKNLIRDGVERHITYLAKIIGERDFRHYEKLMQAANYIEQTFVKLGYTPMREYFDYKGKCFCNIEAEKVGSIHPKKIIIIGAHYNSVKKTSNANNNGTGVAALLELARLLVSYETACTLRFVTFANEQTPFSKAKHMGSYHHAERAEARHENIIGVLSLETISGFSNIKYSSRLAQLLLHSLRPQATNSITFIGNLASRDFLGKLQNAFTKASDFPCQSLAAPGWLPGINTSDQRPFWRHAYPAVMITSAISARHWRHQKTIDKNNKMNYPNIALLILGLVQAIKSLAS